MGKSIEIRVGMIFQVRRETNNTQVIFDTGIDDNISTFGCRTNPLRLVGCASGTAEAENIGPIVMTIKPKIVEKLLVDFWTENGSMNETFRSNIHQAISSKPRRINLP